MKTLVLSTLLIIGLNFSANASVPGVYPSGSSNLLPAAASSNNLLWVGGEVAKNLFNGMTQAQRQTDGFTEARLGEHLGCIHNTFTQEVEYSCAITIEMATGKAVVR